MTYTKSKKAQEKLLIERDLTLNKAISIVSQVERATKSAQAMQPTVPKISTNFTGFGWSSGRQQSILGHSLIKQKAFLALLKLVIL